MTPAPEWLDNCDEGAGPSITHVEPGHKDADTIPEVVGAEAVRSCFDL
jgi:hypothetical protein